MSKARVFCCAHKYSLIILILMKGQVVCTSLTSTTFTASCSNQLSPSEESSVRRAERKSEHTPYCLRLSREAQLLTQMHGCVALRRSTLSRFLWLYTSGGVNRENWMIRNRSSVKTVRRTAESNILMIILDPTNYDPALRLTTAMP